MNRIISSNTARVVIIVFGTLWISLFGAGAVMAIISMKMPYVLFFPIGWVIGAWIIIRLFINFSRKVIITEGSISIQTFKNELVIPFDNIKSISGGWWRYIAMPSDRYIFIELEDDTISSWPIRFVPKLNGYKWNKQHEIVHEVRSVILNYKKEA